MAPTTARQSCLTAQTKQCKAPDIAQEPYIVPVFSPFFFGIKVPSPRIILPGQRQPPNKMFFRPPYQIASATVSKLLRATSNKKKRPKHKQLLYMTHTTSHLLDWHQDKTIRTRSCHSAFSSLLPCAQNLHSCPSLLQVVYTH